MAEDFSDFVGTPVFVDAEILVTESAIRRYAEAVGEVQLFWSEDGRLIAPSTFLPPFALGGLISEDGRRHRPGEPSILPFTAPHRVMGEAQIDFVEPILAGDLIRSSTQIVSISQKSGRSGNLLLMETETRYALADGTLKRRESRTIIVPQPD